MDDSIATILIAISAALPSIITALTKYPKAQGILGTIAKALDVLSVLSHKDAPDQTLKVPGKRSKNPNGKTKEAE